MKRISKKALEEMNKTMSMQDIAKKQGVHRDTVRRWFKAYKIKSKFGKGESPDGNGYEVAVYAKCHGKKKAMAKYKKTADQVYKAIWKFDNFRYAQQKKLGAKHA